MLYVYVYSSHETKNGTAFWQLRVWTCGLMQDSADEFPMQPYYSIYQTYIIS